MIESTVSDTQKWYGLVAKRLMDLIFAAALLLLLWPLFFVIAFGIRISSPGPIVFVQMRMGRGLEPFALYKFRTMRCGAPHDAPTASIAGGAYITGIGRFLRRTSLDELPQLVNVLRGDMSLIGPRPVVLTESELIGRRAQAGVYRVKPGMSGLAQVLGRDQLGEREKTAFDRLYVQHASPLFDLRLLLFSVRPVLLGRGVCEGRGTEEEGEKKEIV